MCHLLLFRQQLFLQPGSLYVRSHCSHPSAAVDDVPAVYGMDAWTSNIVQRGSSVTLGVSGCQAGGSRFLLYVMLLPHAPHPHKSREAAYLSTYLPMHNHLQQLVGALVKCQVCPAH